MRKRLVSVFSFILALMLSISSVSVTNAATSFKDVPSNHWAKKEIDYLVGKDIIQGYKDGTFKPNNHVTNSQVAIMLVRALKLNTNNRPNPQLTDVDSTYHAYKEIATVIDEGIFPKAKRFNPNEPITREAMARALANAFKLQGNGGIYFTDVSTSYWAYQYIVKIALNNITTGYSDGTFKPKNTVTRAQFSAFVSRSLNDSFKPRPEDRSITGGLKLNPEKTYVYNIYDESGYLSDKETWYYKGNDYGWDDWTVVPEKGDYAYYSYFEDNTEMAFGWDDSEVAYYIPFPLMLDTKWSYQLYEGDAITYYVVTNMDKTITTPAGTFQNVIEIKDYDGYYHYYAHGAGLILIVDATQKPSKKMMELVEIY